LTLPKRKRKESLVIYLCLSNVSAADDIDLFHARLAIPKLIVQSLERRQKRRERERERDGGERRKELVANTQYLSLMRTLHKGRKVSLYKLMPVPLRIAIMPKSDRETIKHAAAAAGPRSLQRHLNYYCARGTKRAMPLMQIENALRERKKKKKKEKQMTGQIN
jgi:hypothetical protein